MQKLSLVFLACVSALGCGGSTPPPPTEQVGAAVQVDEPGLVPVTTELGASLLARNLDDADAIPLLRHFESQRHGAHCGIASSVITLNVLGIVAPPSPVLGPFRYFTQEIVIGDESTARVVPAATINTQGMTLDQLGGILEAHGLDVTVTHGADLTLDAFRALVRANVANTGDVVLVNYFRPEVGQEGGGHISPVAAYDDATDRALILDVARYRYPPVFVAIPSLWDAIRTTDATAGLSRGVVEARLHSAPPGSELQK